MGAARTRDSVRTPACHRLIGVDARGSRAARLLSLALDRLGCCSARAGSPRRRGFNNLSIIAVDLVAANATSTGEKIAGLLKKASGGGKDDGATLDTLLSCQALYGGIVGLLPGCAAAIKGGKFDRAALSLERVASATKECEDAFRDHSLASPLTVEDDSTFKLAKLAVALLAFAI